MSQKKPAPFWKIYCAHNFGRKYLKICHETIQLFNKKIPKFHDPNCNRFFSTVVFPTLFKTTTVKDCWVYFERKLAVFSIDYHIVHIIKQNSVEFHNSNHILFSLLCFDLLNSHKGITVTSKPAQSSRMPSLVRRAKSETARTIDISI